jgi:DNA-binding NarL/FixJ family response regulator
MSRSAAHRRQEFDAPKSVSKPVAETVAIRRRPHAQSLAATAIVVEPRPLIRELLTCTLKQRAGLEIVAAASIDEYLEGGGAEASLVIVSIAGNPNSEETRKTLRRAAQALPQTPIVVLSDSEDLHSALSFLQSGTRGYISTAMKLDVAIEVLWLVKAGGQFLPAACIIGPPRSPADPSSRPLPARSHGLFTARQAAVVKALCQGKANKIIAYELEMKESTVKVHVRNIMKKLKAKNRTEVAYITNQLTGPNCEG